MASPNPIQPENPPADVTWWKGHLNVIGLFIGTHGLAVFLVVFYTVYLYPRGEAERKEWIEQITSIRMLVEPETRTLTISQADAVLSIAKRAFTQDLQMNLEFIMNSSGYDSSISWGGDSIRFWGEEFEFEYKRKNINDEISSANELSRVMHRFNSLFEQRELEYRQRLLQAFDRASENAQVLRYQLGRLRSEQNTLDEVWYAATVPLRQEWVQHTSTFSDERLKFPITQFKKFVEKHEAYGELYKTKPELFKYLQPSVITTDVLPIAKIGSTLEQNLAKELKALYAKHRSSI